MVHYWRDGSPNPKEAVDPDNLRVPNTCLVFPLWRSMFFCLLLFDVGRSKCPRVEVRVKSRHLESRGLGNKNELPACCSRGKNLPHHRLPSLINSALIEGVGKAILWASRPALRELHPMGGFLVSLAGAALISFLNVTLESEPPFWSVFVAQPF